MPLYLTTCECRSLLHVAIRKRLCSKEKGDVTKEEEDDYAELIYTKMLQIENMVRHLFEDFVHCSLIVEDGNIVFKIENSGEALPDDLIEWIN